MKARALFLGFLFLQNGISEAKSRLDDAYKNAATRLVVTITTESGVRVIERLPICSGSFVKHRNKIYFATAKHCLHTLLVLQFSAIMKEESALKTVVIEAQVRVQNKFKKGLLVFAIHTGDEEKIEQYVNEHGDGVLIRIEIPEVELKQIPYPVLSLTDTMPVDGETVFVEGFPSGEYKAETCKVVNIQDYSQIVSEFCPEVMGSSFLDPEPNENPMILKCSRYNKHLGGLSGGPVYTSQKTLMGVVHSGAMTYEHANKMAETDFSIAAILSQVNKEAFDRCFVNTNQYYLISPIDIQILNNRVY